MPYCPDCRIEYEDSVKTCTDCGRGLAAGPMPGPPATHGEPETTWTTLMRVRTQESAEIIRGLLESSGIPCEVVDRRFSEMPVPVEAIAYMEIWVPGTQADEARALLNEVREGTTPCKSCGHMSAAGEPNCEYCGAAL